MSSDVLDTWNATTDDELTVEVVEKFFAELWDDELFLASAAIDRVVDDTALARLLLDKALAATETAVERGKSALLVQEAAGEDQIDNSADDEDKGEGPSSTNAERTLAPHDERLLRLLSLRAIALQRLGLLSTYSARVQDPTGGNTTPTLAGTIDVVKGDTVVDEEEEEDDPWADE